MHLQCNTQGLNFLKEPTKQLDHVAKLTSLEWSICGFVDLCVGEMGPIKGKEENSLTENNC